LLVDKMNETSEDFRILQMTHKHLAKYLMAQLLSPSHVASGQYGTSHVANFRCGCYWISGCDHAQSF